MSMDTRQFDTMVGRRQMPRMRLELSGTYIIAHEENPCLLNDLSQRGAGISLGVSAPPLGAFGALSVNGVEAFGTVIWRSGTRFGLKFEEPLPQEEVDRLGAIHNEVEAIGFEERRQRLQSFTRVPLERRRDAVFRPDDLSNGLADYGRRHAGNGRAA